MRARWRTQRRTLLYGLLPALLALLLDATLITLLSSWSRVYLGAHWLSDVAGALLMAGGWLALVIGTDTALERCGTDDPSTDT